MNGDGEAFKKLYRISDSREYFAALCVTRNENDAVKLIRQSYSQAHQRLPRLKYPQKFISWLDRIVARNIYDYILENNDLVFTGIVSANPESFNDELAPGESKRVNFRFPEYMKIDFLEILDHLPDDEKLCFLMYYYFDMSIDEISKIIPVEAPAVTELLNFSKKHIKPETGRILMKEPTIDYYSEIDFFCNVLSSCSCHVPFKATDMILSSILLAGEKNSPRRDAPVKPRKSDDDDNVTRMYSDTEQMTQGEDFTPYGNEYSKGGKDDDVPGGKSLSTAAKVAIGIVLALILGVTVFAVVKNVIINNEKNTTKPVSATTVHTTSYERETTSVEYTTEEPKTEEPTTEEPTTEEPTTEEPITEEPATEEPETEEDHSEEDTLPENFE